LCAATPKVKADDVITPWSQALRRHLQQNQISNSETARQLAVLHVAQHLAVQDVFQTRGLQSNNQQAQRNPDLQPELRAAVAGASKQVLDRIAPQASAAAMPLFNSQTQMQPGNNNVPQQRLQQAQARGAQVADQVIRARVNDASDRTATTPWMGTNDPGKWRATPPDNVAAVDMQWAKVTPWVIDPTALNQQFRMPPPPDLNSEPYRNSYFELRELGRQGSTTRTPDMSAKAEFWTVNPQLSWMQVMDQITASSPNSPGANPAMPRLQLQINGPPPGAPGANGNMNGGGVVGVNGVNGPVSPIGAPGSQNPNPLGPPVVGGQPGANQALPGQVGGAAPNANAPFPQQQQGVNGMPLNPNMPPTPQGVPLVVGQQPGAPLNPNALPGQPGALPQGQVGQNGQLLPNQQGVNGVNPNALPGQPGAPGVGGVNGQNSMQQGQINGMNGQQNQNNGMNNNNNNGMNNNGQQNQQNGQNNNNNNGMNNNNQNNNGMNNNGMNNQNNGMNNNNNNNNNMNQGQVQHTPDGRLIMSIPEAARAYAMATVAAMDTRVATFDNKYFYNAWRPITAIRNGGPGQGMEAQPGWEPFLVTPAAPEYPNGHSTLGGAMCEIMSAFNNAKNETPFPLVLTSANGQQRTYHSMSQIADESAVSRVFSGGHWQHTTPPSMALGKQVGQTILKQFDDKYGVTTATQTLQQQQQRAAPGQQVLAGPGGAQVGVQPGMQGQPGQPGQPGQQQMGQPGVMGQPMQPGMQGQQPGVLGQPMQPGMQGQQGGVLGQPLGQQPGMVPGQQPGMQQGGSIQQQQQQNPVPQQQETPAQARRRRQRQRQGNRALRA